MFIVYISDQRSAEDDDCSQFKVCCILFALLYLRRWGESICNDANIDHCNIDH